MWCVRHLLDGVVQSSDITAGIVAHVHPVRNSTAQGKLELVSEGVVMHTKFTIPGKK